MYNHYVMLNNLNTNAFSRLTLAAAVLLSAVMLSSCGKTTLFRADTLPDGFSAAAVADTKARVDKAIALSKTDGIQEVIRRINEEKLFMDGNSYVFINRLDNRTFVANPAFAEIIGKNDSQIRDTEGNSLAALFDDATREGAWVEYQWYTPAARKSRRKISWVKISGDYIFGSGLYE